VRQNRAKTIQIFLPDGNPRGIRIADITSRNVAAVQIPRSKLEDAAKRDELDSVGIYLLFGESESKPMVYVGEAENSLARLRQHNKGKEFWTHALVFVSKTGFFTKTHIKYLEWLSCKTALEANRFALENSISPKQPHLSESVEADLLDNFETMQILASTLGYPVFDQIKKSKSSKEIIFCKGKDAYAEGEYTEDGVVVFAGGKCNLVESKSAGSWVTGIRSTLKSSGVLVEDDGVLTFTSDHIFPAPSAAAATILARHANGWTEWKFKDGRTLDEVKRQSD
jgi:hypothetical protein